MKWINIT